MAEAVEARRLVLGLNPGQFAEEAKLTRQGASHIRKGFRRRYQEDTIRGVAKALRWERDWYDRLLSGELPVEAEATASSSVEDRLTRLEDAVEAIRQLLHDLDRFSGAPREDGEER